MGDWKVEFRAWRRETRRILRMVPDELRPLVAERLRARAPRIPMPRPTIWVPTREEMQARASVWSTEYTPSLEDQFFSRYKPCKHWQNPPAGDGGALFLPFALEPI